VAKRKTLDGSRTAADVFGSLSAAVYQTRPSVAYGPRGGIWTVVGNTVGFGLLIAVVGLGLSWIASVLQTGFAVIRIVGAAYLIWLGFLRLRNAGQISDYGKNPTGRMVRDGFFVAIANPEVIFFLAAFLPPFVNPAQAAGPQILILAGVFLVTSALTGCGLALAAGKARAFLSGDNLKWLDRLSGSLLILAGGWLLVVA
jgi:homoserine/homoserine lactone efflux protein